MKFKNGLSKLFLIVSLIIFVFLSGCTQLLDSLNEASYNASGYVLDENGNGVEGVTMEFTFDNGNSSQSVITISSGEWYKENLLGEVTVTPKKDNWEFTPVSEKVTQESSTLDFVGENQGLIAYKNNNSIYVMDVDGSNNTLVKSIYGDHSLFGFFDWNSDGTKIVYDQSYDPSPYNYEIYSINEDGSNNTRITNSDLDEDYYASWSHDGNKIAYVTRKWSSQKEFYGPDLIYIRDINGSNVVQLVEGHQPDWHPNSDKLVYMSGINDSDPTIHIMDSSGNNQIELTNGRAPDWSSAGNKIAFERAGDIYIINSDGSNETMLVSGKHPSWSPNDSQIVFERNGNIYVIDLNGNNEINLGNGTIPEWS